MNIEQYIYFATFIENKEKEGSYIITFKDLIDCNAECNNITEGIKKAKEVLELYLWELEESNVNIPVASKPENIKLKKGEFLVPISIYMPDIRKKMNNKATKKTLTIPYWLNKIAEMEKINFSDVLQSSLKKELNINDDFFQKFIKK
ncbi:type II toxin-antitoxin system HicB family antitoxin [Clostridium sp. VAP23]|uniref:type II toxin-antitoxin system HicB family antitoxin n=1 Tax=Clostridium sp. VAP23 TaxID=2949981 RepID=UPI00207AA44E|nr:type II toxin-antitoxin system HicB family antitoxin [Clostridium sp. VAP23]